MAEGPVTRKRDYVPLIGHPSPDISAARLPSGRDILKYFVYCLRKEKRTSAESADCVYLQVKQIWDRASIPIRQKQHIVKKIKVLYKKHADLMKHFKRNNKRDRKNQEEFEKVLDSLFDIRHADFEKLMTNEEDKRYLELQQQSRTGSIAGVDKKLAYQKAKRSERKERLKKHNERLLQEKRELQERVTITDISSGTEDTCTSDEEFKTQASKPKRKAVMSPNLTSVLDRTNTSIRSSVMIVASVLNESGCSASETVISKSTFHRERNKQRKELSSQIKDNFVHSLCVVHWDGKLLLDVSEGSTGKVDRLAILASSVVDQEVKLLGVPKLQSGTGHAQAAAVIEHLNTWNMESFVIGMCFDTTASNTGHISGACTLLESELGRNLLWLACRHHILEILLSDVFSVCFGSSSGPEILLFKRFQEKWPLTNTYKEQKVPLIPTSKELKDFILEQLKKQHSRDDYKEFLQLAALLTGLDVKVTIRKPGAMHRARWMAKAIYSMKMELMFEGNESEMQLKASELQAIQRFNKFVVQVYLQSWYSCQSAIDAPLNDILLIQRLQNYDDKAVKAAGLKMVKRHGWYISPGLAPLVLFSDKISADEKQQLVGNMQIERGPHQLGKLPSKVTDLTLSQSFFETTGIDTSFLEEPVTQWLSSSSYQSAAALARCIPCINDTAERGVALIQKYNTMAIDEEQKQYLLQVVEHHRKKVQSCNKDNLVDI